MVNSFSENFQHIAGVNKLGSLISSFINDLLRTGIKKISDGDIADFFNNVIFNLRAYTNWYFIIEIIHRSFCSCLDRSIHRT